MNCRAISLFLFLIFSISSLNAQSVQDDFEGNGNINTWYGDDCLLNTNADNIYSGGINTSEKVLKYEDIGGQFANVAFDVNENLILTENHVFTFKIYVPSSGISGNQKNQVSLKLQDGTLEQPWSTQSEIIKSIELDQWQELNFDFLNDDYINLDASSPPPTQRFDFNRVLFQVNGENNNDPVIAYIDDVFYDGTNSPDEEFDQLVWSDEFDQNGAIDPQKWHHQSIIPNGDSWFNGEIQHYTDRTDNAQVNDGILSIVAKKENYTDQGVTKQYTSARLNSKFAFTYGKIEVRARMPEGNGTWPAIWMLGKNITENGAYWETQGFGTTSWPACGEIDILEHWGQNPNYVQSAIHTPSSFGATVNHGGQFIPTAISDFHTYTLKWYPEKLVFSVDGVIHYIYQPEEYNEDTWPFTKDQYLLLNFAVLPNIESNFTEDTLEIDYVRVYQTSTSSNESPENLSSFKLNNSPNPAHLQTNIQYHLDSDAYVTINVRDKNGRLINTLVNKNQKAGKHQLIWDLSHLKPGVYFYTLKANQHTTTKKCVVY